MSTQKKEAGRWDGSKMGSSISHFKNLEIDGTSSTTMWTRQIKTKQDNQNQARHRRQMMPKVTTITKAVNHSLYDEASMECAPKLYDPVFIRRISRGNYPRIT